MRIVVPSDQRAIVHVDGRPTRFLGPGAHWIFRPFNRVAVRRFDVDDVVANLRPAELDVIPSGEVEIVTVAPHERAIVYAQGRPVKYLGVGEHAIFANQVRVEIIDTSPVSTPPLVDEVRVLFPFSDYTEVTAPEGTVAIRYVDGALDAILPVGRHAAFTTVRKVTFTVIDLREGLLNVTGQEVMTKDRVTLRLNVSGVYRVADPRRFATIARDAHEVLYLAMQLAVRQAVATRTLDELLATREALADAIAPNLAARAEALGLTFETFGVKDVILPGDMKALLNRVIEAQKEAEANVITRREETAAVRSMAQTAKVLAENPVVLRLKELEAYKDLAGKVGQVHVVLGDGTMPKLQLGLKQ